MAKSEKNGNHLSTGKTKSVDDTGVSGPMPQHRRLAMGEKVDGMNNPYGEDVKVTKNY